MTATHANSADPIREWGIPTAQDTLAADPAVQAVAVWMGESGSLHVWGQGMFDNRRSRVLARIARYGMEPPVELVIVRR